MNSPVGFLLFLFSIARIVFYSSGITCLSLQLKPLSLMAFSLTTLITDSLKLTVPVLPDCFR